MKYEILTDAKRGTSLYEFAVILVYQSRAGTEIKNNEKFSVWKEGSKWVVNSLAIGPP